jgi:nucleotide-binding universal stress UspA family protein
VDIKDILLILSAEELNSARLNGAARLARAAKAAVTGLCLYSPPQAPMSEAFAVGATADADVLDRIEARTEAHLAPIQNAFARAMKGVETVWAQPACELAEETAARARLYDLVVLGVTGSAADRRLAEHLVLQSGTPCLLIPEDRPAPRGFDDVLVAWNGSREARRALSDALPLLQHAVHIEVVAAREAARHMGPEALDAVVQHLARHGLTAEARWLPAQGETAAEALERRVAETNADLLVLGAYSHPHATEVLLGGVTQYLLGDPPTAVLTSR